MKVYRKDKKTGFIETLVTNGSYMPKGWSASRSAAESKK